MDLITSLKNPLIKNVIALHSKKGRDSMHSFIIEGVKVIKEAISNGLVIEKIFYDQTYSLDEMIINAGIQCYQLSSDCMKKISTTSSPVNVLAVVKKFQNSEFSINDLLEKDFILILDGVTDPGNLGTIIRTSCAVLVDCIILVGDSVDIYNPKVVRSTAGALWNIPIIKYKDRLELINKLKDCGIKIISADMSGKCLYNEYDYNKKIALVFGSEAHGISEEFKSNVNTSVRIPISHKVESLNLSVAAGLVLYEARNKKGSK